MSTGAVPPPDEATATDPGQDGRVELSRPEILLGVGLASLSGAAVVAHAFGPLPMTMTVPFVVLPGAALLVGAILLRTRRGPRFHRFADRLLAGGIFGLLATVAYDVIRYVVKVAGGFAFDPYGAHSLFGTFMTGLPESATIAVVAGWLYHFWNGTTFGMMFSLVRPEGGILLAIIWGLVLEWLMAITYPAMIGIRLGDSGFLAQSIVGHITWGIVLGAGLRWWHTNVREAAHA